MQKCRIPAPERDVLGNTGNHSRFTGSATGDALSATDGDTVSAATAHHGADARAAQLAEVEFGMVIVNQAFQRWIVRCMEAAGLKDLTVMDVLVLLHVDHRARHRKVADICYLLNTEDTHVVGYSLRKLTTHNVIAAVRHGKEVTYSTTRLGKKYLKRYQEILERCLLSSLVTHGPNNTVLGTLAQSLRKLSGFYDQAARATTTL